MPRVTIANFEGLDFRRDTSISDPASLRRGDNVFITSGKTIKTRPGTELVYTLSPDSHRLYSGGGFLRAVAPAGYSEISTLQPPGFRYDLISDGTKFALDEIAQVTGVDEAAERTNVTPKSFITIRRKDGTIEYHWVDAEPNAPGSVVNTKVTTSFIPSTPAIAFAEKVWGGSNASGATNFSSTQNGPTDWITPNDAGFLPVARQMAGASEQVGLSYIQLGTTPLLVVAFKTAMQLWSVGPDPATHSLQQVLEGPGVDAPGAMAKVHGDLFYLSAGQIDTLRETPLTGRARGTGIGAAVRELTKDLVPANVQMVWATPLSALLVYDGSGDVLMFSRHAESRVSDWSAWKFPYNVVDITVHEDRVYLRDSDDNVHRMSEDLTTDSGTPIDFAVTLAESTMRSPGRMKRFDNIQVIQDGKSFVAARPRSGGVTPTMPTKGVPSHTRVTPLAIMSEGVTIEFTGQAPWELSAVTVSYQTLRGR